MASRRAGRSRYRVVVYELSDDTGEIVMDLTGSGFVAAVGAFTGQGTMEAHLGQGGHAELIAHLAILAANQLADDHSMPSETR